jgi:vacuolar-type H+-ATPase subunit H
MPTTAKAPAKTPSTHAHCKENDRLVRRITDSLDVAHADLEKLRGSVGSGVSDMRHDLAKLLRDARRDARKLGNRTRKDLEKLQKDMAAASKPKPKPAAKAKPASKAKAASKVSSAKPRRAARAKSAAR